MGYTIPFHADPSLLPKTIGLWCLNVDFEKKKKVRPSIFSVWLHGVEKNERFFFSENGPDDGQAPLGYPQKQYEDGGPPLFLSRSEDIRAGDGPSAYYGRWFCGVLPPAGRVSGRTSWVLFF